MGHHILQGKQERFFQRNLCQGANLFQPGEGLPVRLDKIREADVHSQGGHAGAAGVVILDGFQDLRVLHAVFFPGHPGTDHGMEQGRGLEKGGIVGQIVFNGDFLHFLKAEAFGTVVQQAGLLRTDHVQTVFFRQTHGSPCHGKGMGKAFRIEDFVQPVEPGTGGIQTGGSAVKSFQIMIFTICLRGPEQNRGIAGSADANGEDLHIQSKSKSGTIINQNAADGKGDFGKHLYLICFRRGNFYLKASWISATII